MVWIISRFYFKKLFRLNFNIIHTSKKITIDKIHKVKDKLSTIDYYPNIFIPSPYQQTLIISFFETHIPTYITNNVFKINPTTYHSKQDIVYNYNDGGKCKLIHYKNNKTTDKVITIHPGVNTYSENGYVEHTINTLKELPFDFIVIFPRGHYEDHSSHNYHNWSSYEDSVEVYDYIKSKLKYNKIVAIGYSLGGNKLANYIFRSKDKCKIDYASIIHSPVDLMVNYRMFCPIINYVICSEYKYHMKNNYNYLKQKWENNISKYSDTTLNFESFLNNSITLNDLDMNLSRVIYMKQDKTYNNHDEYLYDHQASSYMNNENNIPILAFMDKFDPAVPPPTLTKTNLNFYSNMILVESEGAGHLGGFEIDFTIYYNKFLKEYIKNMELIE